MSTEPDRRLERLADAVADDTPVEVPPERKLLICRRVRMWAAPFKMTIDLSIGFLLLSDFPPPLCLVLILEPTDPAARGVILGWHGREFLGSGGVRRG